MVATIPESLQASLNWYSQSFGLITRVNRALSDVTLRMPAQGKKLELQLSGCGVITYEWTSILDREHRIATVVIRLELKGDVEATSLELHVQKKGDEQQRLFVATFSSNLVELKIPRLDLSLEYTLSMAMPTVK